MVFEGAKRSIAAKIVGARSLEQQRLQVKTMFDAFIRDNTSDSRPRNSESSFLGDADSAISVGAMSRSRADTATSAKFSDISLVSRSSAGDSGYAAFSKPRKPRDELTRINPIFQELWMGAANGPQKSANPGQNFIGELDGFDAKYFSIPDKGKRLTSGQNLALLNEETAPLLKLFVNGHDITGVHFNYQLMCDFIKRRGSAIASVIKDKKLDMSQKDKSLYILGTILIKGLEKDPAKERTFKEALTRLAPTTKDFFVERNLISA